METPDQGTSSTPYAGEGVGGKIRKPTTRKPPPTPYARPVHNQSERRWISKLVDPAYRLITDGATRLLPYLFSKPLPSTALPSPGDVDQDKVEAEVEETFSREEVSRLLEILQSRALEPSNKVDGKTFSQQSIEKQVEQPSAANRVLKMPHEGKQGDLERATWGNLTPHPPRIVLRYHPKRSKNSPCYRFQNTYLRDFLVLFP